MIFGSLGFSDNEPLVNNAFLLQSPLILSSRRDGHGPGIVRGALVSALSTRGHVDLAGFGTAGLGSSAKGGRDNPVAPGDSGPAALGLAESGDSGDLLSPVTAHDRRAPVNCLTLPIPHVGHHWQSFAVEEQSHLR